MHHVIIGAGPAGICAAETIRQLESEPSQITLLSDEAPHSRMVLPYWLAGSVTREHSHLSDPKCCASLDIAWRGECRVDAIRPATGTVELSDASSLTYDRLLLATGSQPLTPTIPGIDLPGVQPMWSLRDVDNALASVANLEAPRVTLVGAGFVGLIVLSAMFKRGWKLTLVEQQPHVLPRMLDPTAGETVDNWLTNRGVNLHLSSVVEAIRANGDAKQIVLSDGGLIDADLVIVATGVQPNTALAQAAGIALDRGILVDSHMQTNITGIFAAGDAAQGPALLGGPKVVHAIQPTAVDHGRVAGANMAGQPVTYAGSLSMNILDVCGLQCATYGECLRPDLPSLVVADQARSLYRKLVWDDDRLVGAVFTGNARDVGMLSDLGMVKGLIQTQQPLDVWKTYLIHNPFDIRRAYVALGVGQKLINTTLLGRPSTPRSFRAGTAKPAARSPHHALLFDSRDVSDE